MTPEQFKEFLESNERATALAIEKYVNGGIRNIGKRLDEHAAEDKKFQDTVKPITDAFNEKKIVRMKFREETGTLVFYVTSIGVVSTFIMSVWYLIKNNLVK